MKKKFYRKEHKSLYFYDSIENIKYSLEDKNILLQSKYTTNILHKDCLTCT